MSTYLSHFSDPEFVRQSENYWFYDIILSCVCYGINAALSIYCAHLNLSRIRSYSTNNNSRTLLADPDSRRIDVYSLAYAIILFTFATTSIVPVIIVGKHAFTGTRNSSYSPAQYLFEHVFETITMLRVAYIILILCHTCTNGFLMRSFFRIPSYSVKRFCYRWRKMMLTSMTLSLFLASIVLLSAASGTIFIVQVFTPSKLSPYLASRNWVLIWATIATVVKLEITGTITMRLVIFQRSLLRSLGALLQFNYVGIGTMLIQSTMLISSFAIFFMVAYSVKSPSLVMVPFLLFQVQIMVPLLVLYHITSNRMFSEERPIGGPSPIVSAHHHTDTAEGIQDNSFSTGG